MMPLRDALAKAADALENNQVNYDWASQSTCNCGVVTQCLLGLNQFEVSKQISPLGRQVRLTHYTWSDAARAFCPVTGAPIAELFRNLSAAGMTRDNIIHLEYLSDPKILKRCSFWKFPYYYRNRDNLIQYLRAWVSLLDEEAERFETRPLIIGPLKPATSPVQVGGGV